MDAWLGLCEIPFDVCTDLHLKPLVDTVTITTAALSGKPEQYAELTTTVLQVVPTPLSEVRIHPVLLEFLTRASVDILHQNDGTTGVSLYAFGSSSNDFDWIQDDTSLHDLSKKKSWNLSKTNVLDLTEGTEVEVTVLYTDDDVTDHEIRRNMEGRIVKIKSTIIVGITSHSYAILVIHGIAGIDSMDNAYRIIPTCTITMIRTKVTNTSLVNTTTVDTDHDWETDCPGYDSLVEELYALSESTNPNDRFAAPSGILLTGCSGVGKTRLASCLANKIQMNNGNVHWISCHDLVLRASWASESDLLDLLLPRTSVLLVVLDDLHALNTDDADASDRDTEYILVRNSIMVAIDRLVESNTSILGIGQEASKLPTQWVRIGRLEKEIKMEAPTQSQRQAILSTLISQSWAAALTSPTAGFVAADLHRMYIDAWTSAKARDSETDAVTWNDLRDAVHRTTPSQLALLDVTRPYLSQNSPSRQQHGENEQSSSLERHRQSWQSFGGYASVKKRLYRTVVAPWHRHLNHYSKEQPTDIFGLSPPRGVLFHGPSGTGKSFAASCLASSLGLNVVKVRASDVLDQWLGGSEAAIRSLFHRARSAAPCVLYFDEIDAIACNRENEGTESDVSSRILTTLLNEMDGISSSINSEVLVMACTNRLQDLDSALLRPGRLEEHVELKLPTVKDIEEILTTHLCNAPLARDVNIHEFAQRFHEFGASSANIEGVCRDACSLAIRSLDDDNGNSDSIVVSYHLLDQALRNWKP